MQLLKRKGNACRDTNVRTDTGIRADPYVATHQHACQYALVDAPQTCAQMLASAHVHRW